MDFSRVRSLQYETIGSSTTAFEYDSGGNLTAWGGSTGWQYSHNRLTEVPSKGYEFYYTANGERAAWFQTPTMPSGSGYRLRADANGDDCVDDADLGIVLEYYGCEAPWTGICAGGQAADLNEDGLVDDADLAWVSEDYGAFAWLYEYDVYGNLVYAGSPCVGEYEAAYDAFGRRVWERIAATGQSAIETHFLYDGDALVLEVSPSGQPLVQYVWGLVGPVARVDLQNGSNTRYYVLDARGHARALVDSTGSVTDYYEYDAWGNVLPGSFGSTPNPFKWNAAAGYQHVPFTGLYHVGAREYDPRTARWLQRDPIGQSSGDPNLYRYCGNDPVNLSDPSGLWPSFGGLRQWLTTPSTGQLPLVRQNPLGPSDAFIRYRSGTGQPVFINFECVNTNDLSPSSVPAIHSILRLSQNSNEKHIIFNSFYYKIPYYRRDAYVYGTIRVHVRGILTTWADGSWDFEGVVSPAAPDRYDFNRSTHRSMPAELSTSLGRAAGGKPYTIYFVGEKRLSGRYTHGIFVYPDPAMRIP